MVQIEKNMGIYLENHQLMNLCVVDQVKPYCVICYYKYCKKTMALLFKSKEESKHIAMALKNKYIAGTIVQNAGFLESQKGLQFEGVFALPSEKQIAKYYQAYPVAKLHKGQIYILALNYIKLINNQLGIGKKPLVWRSA